MFFYDQVYRIFKGERPRDAKPARLMVLGQAWYAVYAILYIALYGAFLYYSTKHMDAIIRDIQALSLSFETKVVIGLSLAYMVSWCLVFAATVWRGRDIGLEKWQSVAAYLVPVLPRFLVMMYDYDPLSADKWLDVVSSVLWVIVVGIFLYLPPGWRKPSGNSKAVSR